MTIIKEKYIKFYIKHSPDAISYNDMKELIHNDDDVIWLIGKREALNDINELFGYLFDYSEIENEFPFGALDDGVFLQKYYQIRDGKFKKLRKKAFFWLIISQLNSIRDNWQKKNWKQVVWRLISFLIQFVVLPLYSEKILELIKKLPIL